MASKKQTIPYSRETIIEHIRRKSFNRQSTLYSETTEFWGEVLEMLLEKKAK